MSKPRIVLLANNVEELGGAQRIVHVLGQGLAERGYPVQVVGIVPFTPPHAFIPEPAYEQITLVDAPLPKPPADNRLSTRLRPSIRRSLAARARLRAQAVERLAEVLAADAPGVLICAQVWAMEHLQEAGYRGWSVIGQYHSSYQAAASGRDLGRILTSYRDVDALTLLTEADAAAFARHGLQNTRCQRNPLSFWPAELPEHRAQSVLYLGRLSPEKGPLVLAEAWRRLAPDFPEWNLDFMGDGPQRAAVSELTQSIPSMRVLGPTDDPQGALLAAGVLALPSLVEGSPLSLAEAMACGLPAVASDCSAGVRDLVVRGRTGLLAARGDAASLAGGLAALMSDGALRERLGAAAREHVADRRLEQVLDEWEALISWALR